MRPDAIDVRSEARSLLALAAAGLAALAATISSLDGDADLVPFFVALTVAGGAMAWAAHPPYAGVRRRITQLIAGAWFLTGCWIGVLLGLYVGIGGDGPAPTPESTYLGLTATIYHLVGMYGGLTLAMLAAHGRDRRPRAAVPANASLAEPTGG